MRGVYMRISHRHNEGKFSRIVKMIHGSLKNSKLYKIKLYFLQFKLNFQKYIASLRDRRKENSRDILAVNCKSQPTMKNKLLEK